MSASRPSVAVIGASNDRSKFGNKAVRAYRNRGWAVYPVNPNLSEVEGIPAYPSVDAIPLELIHRATFYVPPHIGLAIIEGLARIDIGEVWLNPGSASPEAVARAEDLGLNVVQGCSILDIGENPAEY